MAMVSFTSTIRMGKLIKVSGFDGKSFQPPDGHLFPGTTCIVAQTTDNLFYLIDPLNGRPPHPLAVTRGCTGLFPVRRR